MELRNLRINRQIAYLMLAKKLYLKTKARNYLIKGAKHNKRLLNVTSKSKDLKKNNK